MADVCYDSPVDEEDPVWSIWCNGTQYNTYCDGKLE